MPLVAMIASFLISSLIFRLFIATGLSVVTFYFVNDLVSEAKVQIQNAFYGLPADVLAFVQLYKIDQSVSVVLSAYTIAAFIKTAKIAIGKS